MEILKKAYCAPVLVIHGNIESVTQSVTGRLGLDAVYPGGGSPCGSTVSLVRSSDSCASS